MSVGRRITTIIAVVSALLLVAAPAFAGHCTVADKPADSGIAAVIDIRTGDPVWLSTSTQKRIQNVGMQQFLETFHGWLGIDLNGDQEADVSILIPGNTEGGVPQLPETAYENGPECHGTMHVEEYIANCL